MDVTAELLHDCFLLHEPILAFTPPAEGLSGKSSERVDAEEEGQCVDARMPTVPGVVVVVFDGVECNRGEDSVVLIHNRCHNVTTQGSWKVMRVVWV